MNDKILILVHTDYILLFDVCNIVVGATLLNVVILFRDQQYCSEQKIEWTPFRPRKFLVLENIFVRRPAGK